MEKTSEILFNFLRNLIYNPHKASLDLDSLAPEFKMLGQGLQLLSQMLNEERSFAKALAKGDLSMKPPSSQNELAAPLKALQASLRHITWQTQQVAGGDYSQQVDFMGEFSKAFNSMIEQLDTRQKALEKEIAVTKEKTHALEQSNSLLSTITSSIPQMIIVLREDSNEVLFQNTSAQIELYNNPSLRQVLRHLEYNPQNPNNKQTKLFKDSYDREKYISIRIYGLEWNGSKARAFLVSDVTAEQAFIKDLEQKANVDEMTQLHNRFYGMQTFQNWLDDNKSFSLCFVDLDNLKYVNDTFGHMEGDSYIINSANALKTFSQDTVVCRLGGDEFMVLVPDRNESQVNEEMGKISQEFERKHKASGKPYFARMSFGVAGVDPENQLSASQLLALADERMYEHKKSKTCV